MSILVIKRDGTKVPFEKAKIISAILKAFKAVDGEISEYARAKAENIADYIEGYDFTKNANIEDKDDIETIKKKIEIANSATVEEIQDLVEHGLMATKRKDVARAYISYRDDRTREREKKSPCFYALVWNSSQSSLLCALNIPIFTIYGRTIDGITK